MSRPLAAQTIAYDRRRPPSRDLIANVQRGVAWLPSVGDSNTCLASCFYGAATSGHRLGNYLVFLRRGLDQDSADERGAGPAARVCTETSLGGLDFLHSEQDSFVRFSPLGSF